MEIIGFLAAAIAVLIALDLLVTGRAAAAVRGRGAVSVVTHPATWLVLLLVAVILIAGLEATGWR